MGPTAAGKTELAFALHDKFPLEIISVDSALVYRGMDIGTAKPSLAERQRYPHHLVDILDPAESYSAARFRKDALKLMAEVHSRGKIPLLVGGTMLYFRALLQGLAVLPDAQPELRKQLEQRLGDEGLQALHAELAWRDPGSAERIHENDPQRILRALEVVLATGKPMTEHWSQQSEQKLPYRILKLALWPEDRAALHARIAQRFQAMLESGLVDEVKTLYQRGDLNESLPSIRSVGYRQVWQFLDGHLSEDMMRDRGVIATRQLAKRQITWLRSESDLRRLDALTYQFNRVFEYVNQFLDG